MATIIGSTFRKTPAYQYIRDTDHLPSTDDAAAQTDPMCRVKLFNPSGIGTWFIAGFDPSTGIAYGVADLHERESGDFSMQEIADLRCPPFGLPVERDLYFKPARLSAVLLGDVR